MFRPTGYYKNSFLLPPNFNIRADEYPYNDYDDIRKTRIRAFNDRLRQMHMLTIEGIASSNISNNYWYWYFPSYHTTKHKRWLHKNAMCWFRRCYYMIKKIGYMQWDSHWTQCKEKWIHHAQTMDIFYSWALFSIMSFYIFVCNYFFWFFFM